MKDKIHNLRILIFFSFFGVFSLLFCNSIALAAPLARLESPAPDAFFRSGIGLIRGWSCDTGRVEVSINGGPLMATAYGTDRPDTAPVCGRVNTGFGLIYNWNRLGEGIHNLRAFADGVEFANINFTVATLGKEFFSDLLGNYTVQDFPTAGSSAKIRWSEPHQNFVFTTQASVPSVNNPPTLPTARLESPFQGSSESGIGLIRGWVCQAGQVEISINGGPRMATAHGTDRPDTLATCGRTNTGFGLTHNWNRTGNGIHNLRAFADGVEFANVNFSITTLGSEFITDLLSKIRLQNFPGVSSAADAQIAAEGEPATTLQWSEADQNFIITNSTVTGAKVATISAVSDILNKMAVLGAGARSSETLGLQAVKNSQGRPTDINGLTWADTNAQVWADLSLGADGLPNTYKDSAGVAARLDQFTGNSVAVQFVDSSGQARGVPITVPVKGNFLQLLQQRINELRQSANASAMDLAPAPNTGAGEADRNPFASSNAFQFSLNSLFIKLFGSGSIAAGEILCALRTAASNAGLPNPVAATSCQSPLISDFLALANTANPQAMATNDLLDSKFQQSLQFVQNVTDAPCAQPGDSVSCLIAASADLRDIATPGRQISPDSSNPPPTSNIAVPDLVGRNEAAAREALQLAGLTLGIVTQEASSSVPAGIVIRQNPPAGFSVTSGSAVNLVVSAGPAPVNVPNVVGLSQSAATSALQSAGLTLGTVTEEKSSTVPAGRVIRQNPAAGASVAPGSAVNLVISSGPNLVTVPNVLRLYQSAATSALENAGLTVGEINSRYLCRKDPAAFEVVAGQVFGQNPSGGTSVVLGTAVDLEVSLGPGLVTVPNVIGLNIDAAGSALYAADIMRWRPQSYPTTNIRLDRSVFAQSPSAGTEIRCDVVVDVSYYIYSPGGPASQQSEPAVARPTQSR